MTTLIPRSVLFGNPERSNPSLSPDGTRLAYLAPDEGVMNIWVGPVGLDASPVTAERSRPIRSYGWAHDGRHMFYLQDTAGTEDFHLFTVDLETRAVRDLIPFEGVQTQLLSMQKSHPDELLIGINHRDKALHDLYRVTLSTGALELVAENPGFGGFNGSWLIDRDHRVRGGIRPHPDGGCEIQIAESDGDGYETVLFIGAEDGLTTTALGFTGDGKSLYLRTSLGANATRLAQFDLATREYSVIAEDAAYDVAFAKFDPNTYNVQLVSIHRARLELVVIDPAVKADVEALRALDDGDLVISGGDDADRVWLVSFLKDAAPSTYYAYDRSTKTATLLFADRPELEGYELAPVEPFSFTSRDGLTVHGYLTFPVGVARTNLPTVLKVHGGPWGRDMWGWVPDAQWIANRGYLCVMVDYRGSTGYGKDFITAGDREWAGKMHDDLIDAVEHVIAEGYADRDKVAIYGGSYGGYAALVGATFTPDTFCCAVDYVGPSNLISLLETIPPYWGPMRNIWHTRLGHPELDRDELWAKSPLSRVDAIRIPMLIAQGANDPRVKRSESEQIVAAMREKGIVHEYLLFPDEGHGFAKPENNIRFHAAAERFLAAQLGGRMEPKEAGA